MSRYQAPSESQINADALARRGSPYTAASDASFTVQWDHRRREPQTLRDAVRQVRHAYADEVPDKLHDGPDAIGEDGTPRMTARAVGYIFGSSNGSDVTRDPETGKPADLVSYYHSPFRAALDTMAHGSDTQRLYAAIVQKVTIGSQGPAESALACGVRPEAIAKGVALMALRSFLRSITDMKLHLPHVRDDEVAVA